MKRAFLVICLFLACSVLVAENKLVGDYSAMILLTKGEAVFHISDNNIIDMVINGEASSGKIINYPEKNIIEIVGSNLGGLMFRVEYYEDHIDLFLLPSMTTGLIDMMIKPLAINEDANEISYMFFEKMKVKFGELFNEIPFIRLYKN